MRSLDQGALMDMLAALVRDLGDEHPEGSFISDAVIVAVVHEPVPDDEEHITIQTRVYGTDPRTQISKGLCLAGIDGLRRMEAEYGRRPSTPPTD